MLDQTRIDEITKALTKSKLRKFARDKLFVVRSKLEGIASKTTNNFDDIFYIIDSLIEKKQLKISELYYVKEIENKIALALVVNGEHKVFLWIEYKLVPNPLDGFKERQQRGYSIRDTTENKMGVYTSKKAVMKDIVLWYSDRMKLLKKYKASVKSTKERLKNVEKLINNNEEYFI